MQHGAHIVAGNLSVKEKDHMKGNCVFYIGDG